VSDISADIKPAAVEGLLRDTLVRTAKAGPDFWWDVSKMAADHPTRQIVNIFDNEINGFSKFKLAKMFLRWTRTNSVDALRAGERGQWKNLINKIDSALK